MRTTKIETMHGRTGQYLIYDETGVTFQSYGTTIAHRAFDGSVTLDEIAWDYSRTTGKYRNQFLGETKPETELKIASGEYKLADLR